MLEIHGKPVCDGIMGRLVASVNVEMHATSSTFYSAFVVW